MRLSPPLPMAPVIGGDDRNAVGGPSPAPDKSDLAANPSQGPLLSERAPLAIVENTGVLAASCCHNSGI